VPVPTFTLTGNIDELTGGDSKRVTVLLIRSTYLLSNLAEKVSFEPETRLAVTGGSFSVQLPAQMWYFGTYGFVVSAPQYGDLRWYVPGQEAGVTIDLAACTDVTPVIDPLITLADIQEVQALGTTNDTVIAAQVASTTSATRAALDTYSAPFVRKGTIVRNVRDYGATGNGTTDDTAAVQAAIDAGGITFFPAGDYRVNGLVAPVFGLHLMGAGRAGAGRARLKTIGGHLLTTASGVIAHVWKIEGLWIESVSGGGHCMTGGWALGSITDTSFVQGNAGMSAINVTAWVDVSVQDTTFDHLLTATVPTFKGLSAVGDLAQFEFANCRFTNTGNYAIWLEATNGTIVINGRLTNVNFEIPVGGAVKLLSARKISIEHCGLWDFHSGGASKHLVSLGQSATAGATNRDIVIRQLLRDASTAPLGGIYDIWVDSNSTTNLVIDSCGHQTNGAFYVAAGLATGRIIDCTAVTFSGAGSMSTDFWQTWTPTPGGTGTALGNGTRTAKYRRDGNRVEFWIKWVLGTTSTIGSGGVAFPLPIAAVDNAGHTGLFATYTDTGVNSYPGAALLSAGTSEVKCYTWASPYASVSATAPFTWGSTDVLEVRGSYEVAT